MAQLIASLKPPPYIAQLYPQQREVARSTARFKAVTVPRQTGKTVLLSALAAESLEQSGFDEITLYLAKTRVIGKELIWGKLHELNRQYNLGWSFNEASLRVSTPRGGGLIVRGALGANPREEIEGLRGPKYRRALIDEPATYSAVLDTLLDDVVEPGLSFLAGDVVIAGTPGIVCAGPWYEISTGKTTDPRRQPKRNKWYRKHWQFADNPYREDPLGFLEQTRLANGWDDDDAQYVREWLGLWKQSETAQVYRYLASRNDVFEVPGYGPDWVHTIGVDFGQKDSTAWVVLASAPHAREIYVIHAEKKAGLRADEITDHTASLVQRFNPHRVCGDGGNLGGNLLIQQINERLGRRDGVYMVPADKRQKRASIELINGDLRNGSIKFLQPQVCALTDELVVLPWSDETRTHEHAGYENHLSDSLNYAWKLHRAYLHEPEVIQTHAALTPDSPQWLDKEFRQISRPWWER